MRNQFRSVFSRISDAARCTPDVHPYIASFRPPQTLKLVQKCAQASFGLSIVAGDAGQNANTSLSLGLLRIR
jgi:hypothetical protein